MRLPEIRSGILGLALLLLLAVVAIHPPAAEACSEPLCCVHNICIPCSTTSVPFEFGTEADITFKPTLITPVDDDQALVTVTGFATTSMFTSLACPIAFAPIEEIRSIDSVTVVESETGEILRALTFAPNANAGEGYASLASEAGINPAGADSWLGFLSIVSEDVAEGVANHFVFAVTLEKGVTVTQLAEALRADGVLGLGAGLPDGTPDGGHMSFRALGAGDIFIAFPREMERSPNKLIQ